MSTFQHPRGMPDLLPSDTHTWDTVLRRVTSVLEQYGYQEIRTPLLEAVELFKRSTGEVTDIVQKEMYELEDRNGQRFALRPENTPGCVRAGIQHGLLFNQKQRLWYAGPMFRYERPQQGRLRQFHQIGAEAFGFADPDMDIEMLAMSSRLLKAVGIKRLQLKLNTLGTPAVRQVYRDALLDYLGPLSDQLDEDSQARLSTNPLRILDSKAPQTQALLDQAPTLMDCLDDDSEAHIKAVTAGLDTLGIEYEMDMRLVRGLDYYTHTVFEWQTDELGAQNAVCAGGRYDGLVEQLGGKPTPGIGFAMGVERLIALVALHQAEPTRQVPLLYWVAQGDAAKQQAWTLQEQCRAAFPKQIIVSHAGEGSFKSQMKRADQSGAQWAAILGDTEVAQGQVTLKPLLTREPQQSVPMSELIAFLSDPAQVN